MPDFGITEIAALASALAAAGGLAKNLATGTPSTPHAPALPKPPTQDLNTQAKGALPGVKADSAARGLGGAAPEFLQGLVGNELGVPGQLNILDEIRRSTGGAGIQAS